jgi:deazaflavin-dependent oxidoreductase (nitroreductase family)
LFVWSFVTEPRQVPRDFKEPNAIDRIINRAFGLMLNLGIGLSHNYLLEVRGRKSGRTYATPVNVLEHEGRKYLVAPRGYTQWVRNAEASGEATLVRGAKRERVKLLAVAHEAKAELLKIYLDRFKLTVQRYFPIPAGSPAKAFEPLAVRYPIFELSRYEPA